MQLLWQKSRKSDAERRCQWQDSRMTSAIMKGRGAAKSAEIGSSIGLPHPAS
jgi:hypothetical protein